MTPTRLTFRLHLLFLLILLPASLNAAPDRRPHLSLKDRAEITDLLHKSTLYLDSRTGSAWASTFTEDGKLSYPGTVIEGRENLITYGSRTTNKLSSHFIGNTLIVPIARNRAHARSMVIIAARERTASAPTQIAGVAYYDDIIVRTRSGWRLQTRQAGGIEDLPIDRDFLP